MAVPRAQEIIDKAAHERTRYLEWVQSVPDDAWAGHAEGGTWQARDYVAHLASIDPLLTAVFRGIAGAAAPSARNALRIDDWNEEQILARRERSIDELLDEMAAARVDLNAALADFTDEQLDSIMHFGGDAKRAPRDVPLHVFLSGWVFHDRWHMEDARRAIAGEPEQPFGDEAFARAMPERSPSRG